MPMTTLKNITPSPKQASAAYRETFAPAVKDAGGKDGRITRASAERLANTGDAGKLVADNIIDHLEKTGKKSVGVNVFLSAISATVETEVAAVAGANQRMSLVELRNLPNNLVPDLLHLRGKDDLKSPSSLPRMTFTEEGIYEALFYQDPPWAPTEEVKTGTIDHDGTHVIVGGLSGMRDAWAPAVNEILTMMWDNSFQYRGSPADLPLRIPDEGFVRLGEVVDDATGKAGLLVHWKDLDDSSYAWFFEKKADGSYEKLHTVFLN
jgi:hypothetical protein